ncbi:chromosome partitioning protein [Actinotalea sp. C106]|nr:chromosome partitioning protein [Actinotalea sp. C106]
MSDKLPDSFDPDQPDLPTKAVDPDPVPDKDESAEHEPKRTAETS